MMMMMTMTISQQIQHTRLKLLLLS